LSLIINYKILNLKYNTSLNLGVFSLNVDDNALLENKDCIICTILYNVEYKREQFF